MYNNKVLKEFLNEDNVGVVKRANAKAIVKSEKHGDIISISLRINDNLIVEEAKYKAFGGVIANVCASVLCDIVTGKNLLLAQKLTSEDVVQQVGSISEEDKPVAALAVIALLEAIKKYLKRMQRRAKMQENKA